MTPEPINMFKVAFDQVGNRIPEVVNESIGPAVFWLVEGAVGRTVYVAVGRSLGQIVDNILLKEPR